MISSPLFPTPDRPRRTQRAPIVALGDAVLELISAPANSTPATGRGLDHIRIAVKDFNADSVRRVLRERGIAVTDGAAPETVRIADPDGMPIELAAAN